MKKLQKLGLLLFLLYYPTTFLVAQHNYQLKGEVLNPIKEGLSLATVYITLVDSTQQILTFGTTDEGGRFTLNFQTSKDSVLFHARYLGYLPRQTPIALANLSFVSVELMPNDNELKTVVVKEKKPAIIEKNDTTIYRTGDFRDSTEYSVEDVLKKLPGIEVKESGQIYANGKPIETVLVEGSNLFGRKYTIGTKNIRADFIGTVEVIENYSENPILKEVNLAEATVLNLKLTEDKKNVVSATLDVGGGYGAGVKGSLHSNIFNIHRKRKVILLTDNGNTGLQSGLDEYYMTYWNPNKKTLENLPDLLQSPTDLTLFPTIRGTQLPKPFTKDALNSFSTVRMEFNLPKDFNLKVRSTFNKQNDSQLQFFEQSFLYDSTTYQLLTQEKVSLNNTFLENDMTLWKYDIEKGRSFKAHLRWDFNKREGITNIEQIEDNTRLIYPTHATTRLNNWMLGLNYSFQTKKKQVGQLQTKLQQYTKPENLIGQNQDYPLFFDVDTAFQQLVQRLSFRDRLGQLTARYAFTFLKTTYNVDVSYQVQHTLFSTNANLEDDIKPLPIFDDATSSVLSHQLRAAFSTRHHLSPSLSFLFFGSGSLKSIEHPFAATPQLFEGFELNVKFKKEFGKHSDFNIGYQQNSDIPNNQDFISTPFFYHSFTFFQPTPQLQNTSYSEVYAQFYHKHTFQFFFFNIGTHYTFNQRGWNNSVQFLQSLQTLQPFFANNNNRFVTTTTIEKFIPSLKTNLALSANYSFSQENQQFNEQNAPVLNQGFRWQLVSNMNLLHGRLGLDVKWRSIHQFAKLNDAVNHVTNNTFTTKITFKNKYWRATLSHDEVFGKSQNITVANISGNTFEASREIAFFKKKAKIIMMIYNISNTDFYERLYQTDFLLYRESIVAVPRFVLFKLDIGI